MDSFDEGSDFFILTLVEKGRCSSGDSVFDELKRADESIELRLKVSERFAISSGSAKVSGRGIRNLFVKSS